jgi:hypothetical protein
MWRGPDLLTEAIPTAGASREFRPLPNGELVLVARAPSQFEVPTREGLSRLRIRFGVIEAAPENSHVDSIEFRVAARVNGETRVLWSRRLDPFEEPRDRQEQLADIDLPEPSAGVLLFWTLAQRGTDKYLAYWARAEAE